MKKYIIANYYPQIQRAIKAGASISEIKEILSNKFKIQISAPLIVKTIKEIESNDVVKNANKLICFYPFNDTDNSDYLDYAIAYNRLWLASPAALELIDTSWLITDKNITKLESNNAKILAKWLLQRFELTNEYILNNAQLSDHEESFINSVPLQINNIIKEYSKITKKKYLSWIFKVDL